MVALTMKLYYIMTKVNLLIQLLTFYLVIITDERNEGAQNAMNAAIEYVSNNNLTMVNSSTFIKMGKTPKETVQKGVVTV